MLALSLSAGATAPMSPVAPMSPRRAAAVPGLVLIGRDDPRRPAVEAFVRGVYARRYGAEVRQFAPRLVALYDAEGEIVAAAGYRSAASGPLFLERYLAAPVESLLGCEVPEPAGLRGRVPEDAGRRCSSEAPRRERIVEVGHLAASRAGEGRRLITLLGPHLAANGFQWVVSTLTEELRHLFLRLGVAPLALGVADPAVLGAELVHWGSYYDHRPQVLAGHLEAALQALARRRVLSRGQLARGPGS